jgi:predicted alpha/beta hydrolase family esterase
MLTKPPRHGDAGDTTFYPGTDRATGRIDEQIHAIAWGSTAPLKYKSEAKMRKQVLFIQGGGEGTHDEWDDKLVASLERELGPDYEIRYPRMPDEGNPQYSSWKMALQQEFGKLRDGAILIGHSIGGTILIAALAEHTAEHTAKWMSAGVFLLAAPFAGEGGWPDEEIESMSDLGTRLPAGLPIYLYYGSKDDTVPFEHVGLYAEAIPRAFMRQLAGRDHQLNNDLAEVAADVRRLTESE